MGRPDHVGVLFAGLGWLMAPISWAAIGLFWAYNIVWMVIMDVAKLGTYRRVEHRAPSLALPRHAARVHVSHSPHRPSAFG